MQKRLLDYREQGYSQTGEQGIILRIMDVLGIKQGLCCEFGAWDGIHLSNTRQLMENGWRGLMIEADNSRYQDLLKTYPVGSSGICACALVGTGENSLTNIAARASVKDRFDLISIDVDGMDFQIFESLSGFEKAPLVVVVEIHTCHSPHDEKPIPIEIAKNGVGQPFGLFLKAAQRMGYRLVSFIATNAFFIHADAGHRGDLPTLTGEEAQLQNIDLIRNNKFGREYLFLANLGMQPPHYEFGNSHFSRKSLGIGFFEALRLRLTKSPSNGLGRECKL
jgi:hypothetical protein